VGMRKWVYLSLDMGFYGRRHKDGSTQQAAARVRAAAAAAAIKQPRGLVTSTSSSTMSIIMNQKFYKPSSSGTRVFSSCFYLSPPGTHISSSKFYVESGSIQSVLGTNMSLVRGYRRAGNVGGILSVRVDPNIQVLHPQEKKQIKTLNKFASFYDKILETKLSLLQQQRMCQSNVDSTFESNLNNFQRQQDTMTQEEEHDNMQGLVENFKNKSDQQGTEMENECVLIEKDVIEAYMNKVELASHLEGMTDDINYSGSYMKKRSMSCSPRSQTYLWSVHGQQMTSIPPEIIKMNGNIIKLQAETESLKDQRDSLEATILLSSVSSPKAMIVKKIETPHGKLVSESFDVLPKCKDIAVPLSCNQPSITPPPPQLP
ncbi:LOW QUALITY PROTEIN: Keratin, type II cytoskeletal 8, partial [Galemys pyrenaicus]